MFTGFSSPCSEFCRECVILKAFAKTTQFTRCFISTWRAQFQQKCVIAFPHVPPLVFLWGLESSSLSPFTIEWRAVIGGAISAGLSCSEVMKSSVLCLFVHGVGHHSHLSQGKAIILASAHTCCFPRVQLLSACCLQESSVLRLHLSGSLSSF